MTHPHYDPICHAASTSANVSADIAFARMCDPVWVGEWSLGSFQPKPSEAGTYCGRSLYDDGMGCFRIDADPARRLVDYHVGASPDSLAMRISARILPGETFGLGADRCYITLLVWRPAALDELRWRRMCATHDAEIHLIRGRLEMRKDSKG